VRADSGGLSPRESSLGVLYVIPDRGRQGELKSCTPPGGAGGPQAAAMRLNDRPADAKPHAGAVRLGGKKRIEDLVLLLRGKSYAGVADRHLKLLVLRALRLDGMCCNFQGGWLVT
jgi:hypothetical protein